jgi:hypothetical protein
MKISTGARREGEELEEDSLRVFMDVEAFRNGDVQYIPPCCG